MTPKCWILVAVSAALAIGCALAPSASAVVVHTRAGHFRGVAPRPGASIPGSVTAATRAATVTSAGFSWRNLSYQGGPVLHSSDPYLIFWAPSPETIPSSWQSLIERYFTDVAADSGKATNVYGVARQYTDGAGFADYQQTFDPAGQVVQDTDPYPATDSTNCADSPYTLCLTDDQLQAEISAQIAALGLPSDGPTSSSELPDGAPIYFVVLPSDVDVCFADGSGTCASNDFCAYHSAFADGANNVLYATIPAVALASPQDAKGCQWDGNSLVQEPNASIADVALKYISHEDNETITDPLGIGWWNDYTGNEDGDNCNSAFTPTLGGDAVAGTLYNQLIAGDQYYLQSEWSNGSGGCAMQPAGATITPRFSVPAGPRTAGSALSFDPSASTGTYRFSSETWNFGDGTATSFHAGRTLTAATHTYAAPGDYTVTLTLVDNRGNLTTGSEEISVDASPTAALTVSPGQVYDDGGPVSFDASGSSDAGASITSYAWDFGDGATAQGPTASHAYTTPGTYLVRLTVTDSLGQVDTATATVTVLDEPPVAAFAVGAASPEAGQSIGFDGSGSSDSDGSIVAHLWDFGDGHHAGGATRSHTFASPRTYTVTLTVVDNDGVSGSATHQVTVLAGPSAHFTPPAGRVFDRTAIRFDATGSAGGGSGAAITSYAWSFGDGATGTGATPSHVYVSAGSYQVKLTVTDGAGVSSTTTQTVTVLDQPPIAVFGSSPAVPVPGQPISFDGTGSSDPDGTIVSYAWDFGDGVMGTGASATHAYAGPGTYTVRLTVTDRAGQKTTVSRPVTVYAQPWATFSYSPLLPVEGAASTFSAAASGADPSTMISAYAWNFGDGTTATGPTVAHTYASDGTYTVTLTVTDGFGMTSRTTEVVTVIDSAPTAAISVVSQRPAAGRAVWFSGARSHDLDDQIVSYLWHFGDHSGAVGKKLRHRFARGGTYRVSLTVRDSHGQTATTTTTVRVARAGAFSRDRRSHERRRRKR
ncbi:MAG TPA: PKD domain-containing protein [Solirubrobacteraceae bacterium]|nr:PKD domain-containing protein [Solirubrobacteraceae bacterium]